MSSIDRKFQMPAVGELEIARADLESVTAAAALDDITGAGRKSAGQSLCSQLHEILLNSVVSARNQMKEARQTFRDRVENLKSLWNSVESRPNERYYRGF